MFTLYVNFVNGGGFVSWGSDYDSEWNAKRLGRMLKREGCIHSFYVVSS